MTFSNINRHSFDLRASFRFNHSLGARSVYTIVVWWNNSKACNLGFVLERSAWRHRATSASRYSRMRAWFCGHKYGHFVTLTLRSAWQTAFDLTYFLNVYTYRHMITLGYRTDCGCFPKWIKQLRIIFNLLLYVDAHHLLSITPWFEVTHWAITTASEERVSTLSRLKRKQISCLGSETLALQVVYFISKVHVADCHFCG